MKTNTRRIKMIFYTDICKKCKEEIKGNSRGALKWNMDQHKAKHEEAKEKNGRQNAKG
jgi:hypothetical protein